MSTEEREIARYDFVKNSNADPEFPSAKEYLIALVQMVGSVVDQDIDHVAIIDVLKQSTSVYLQEHDAQQKKRH